MAQRLLNRAALNRTQPLQVCGQVFVCLPGRFDKAPSLADHIRENRAMQLPFDLPGIHLRQRFHEPDPVVSGRHNAHGMLAGGHPVVLAGAIYPYHMPPGPFAVEVARHGAGMVEDLIFAEGRIDPVHQKTAAGAHGRQHAGDEIGVVPVVVVGVGEDVDEHVGCAQGALGHLPVLVAAAGAGVEIGRIQQCQSREKAFFVAQQRIAGRGQFFHGLQQLRRATEGVAQGIGNPGLLFVLGADRDERAAVDPCPTSGGRERAADKGIEQSGFARGAAPADGCHQREIRLEPGQ